MKPPLSMRGDPKKIDEFRALRGGIPDGLRPSMLNLTLNLYAKEDYFGNHRVDLEKLQHLERITNRIILPDSNRDSLDRLQRELAGNDVLHLDALDTALRWGGSRGANELETYFQEARSTYCVRTDADRNYEIQLRQPKEMTDLIDQEVARTGRASEHLSLAWSKCFGRYPDLNEACIEAVKAIEVAAKPIIIPDDSMATLGKIRNAMRDKSDNWETDSEFDRSIETIVGMISMVWEGHQRHGDESVPLNVTQESAVMTVHMAVLLVSWFSTGRLRRKNQYG